MSKHKAPIVAIVGRANVGKSSLFNAILHRREAVVAREAGTTRDSITAKAEHKGQDFWIVDTAGLKEAEDEFEITIQEQIVQAADSADLILVVVEATTIISEDDRKIARLALRSKKPLALLINKADKASRENLQFFERLGIKPIFKTSATQYSGIDEVLDYVVESIPKATIKEDNNRLRLAIIGRPNSGKSSLFNALAKKQQAIVADVAGTTRDINRTIIKFKKREIELLDTAGIRRSGKIQVGIEKFSVLRALKAIEESDICILMMDVNEPSTQLDQKIAGLIADAGKGLIISLSKWDSIDKDPYTRDKIARQVKAEFAFTPWAPLIFTSSVSGQNVTKLFELAEEIDLNRNLKITTSKLNSWLGYQTDKHPPAGLKNRHPKLNYMVQINDADEPTFKIFGSHTTFLHWSYKRYLERELRKNFGFEGTAIKLIFLEKHIDKKKLNNS